jgi:hypothetical protein
MATIVIIVVILACIAGQILWGSVIRSFAIFISAVLGMLIAMNFSDSLAQKLISSDMVAWKAHGIVLGLVFVLSFGILVALCLKMLGGDIAFSPLIDKIGGAVISIPTGLVVAGTIVVALALASGSGGFPYERFSADRPDVESPRKPLLGADGFAAGFFGLVSSGSLAGNNSFALVRAGFNDSIAIDRIGAEKTISPLANSNVIQLPVVIRRAPAGLTKADGKKLEEVPGSDLFLARMNMTKSVVGKDSPNFLLGQLRIVCKRKDDVTTPYAGSGTSIYPTGYLKTATRLQVESLSAIVPMTDAETDSGVKAIDFAFYIPSSLQPKLVAFKRNFVTGVQVMNPEEAPAPVGFETARAVAPASGRPGATPPGDPNS